MSPQFEIGYPHHRPRRNRKNLSSRLLTQENTLTCTDLIYPIFVQEKNSKDQIPSLKGQYRLGPDHVLKTVEKAVALNIHAIAIFPVIESQYKSEDASAAYDEHGLIPQTIRNIKKAYPDLTLITDIALDPYTSHGQDGLLNPSGEIENDATTQVLVEQALTHARAGASAVAPSDMMDGRIQKIREALEKEHFVHTQIISYTAKYASALYGPFRDAVGSALNLGNSSKETYQMNPANSDEAIREAYLDISEGADMIMVKPAGFYLDIIYKLKQQFHFPTLAYQVSGEYAMLELGISSQVIDREKAILESLLSIKRAGADAIFTYYALDAAQILQSH